MADDKEVDPLPRFLPVPKRLPPGVAKMSRLARNHHGFLGPMVENDPKV
jgi:hypothetical protein